jgi:hypothetical protein
VDGFAALPYRAIDAGPSVCAFARGDAIIAVVPLRVGVTTAALRPDELGDDDRWTDLLTPLDAAYGDRRPRVYVRADR